MNEDIFLDIDRDRIKSILSEAYEHCKLMLSEEFFNTREEFVNKIDPYLDSNRVSVVLTLDLPSRNYPELKIEVDLRRKSVIARMANKKKRVFLNRYLTKL